MAKKQDVKQDAIPDITLNSQSPEAKAVTEKSEVSATTPAVQIMREIASVVIEVPLCRNPPPRGYTRPPHINLQLTKGRSKEGRHTLHRLHWGLKEIGAKLANGRPVRDRNDVLIWLLDQIDEANAPVNT